MKMKLPIKTKTLALILTVVFAASAITALGATVYTYNPSNTQTGTENPQATATPPPTVVNTALVLSPTVWTSGDQITLTATLDHANAGVTVKFYEGTSVATGTLLGTAATDNNGVATLTFTPSSVTQSTQRTYIAQPQ